MNGTKYGIEYLKSIVFLHVVFVCLLCSAFTGLIVKKNCKVKGGNCVILPICMYICLESSALCLFARYFALFGFINSNLLFVATVWTSLRDLSEESLHEEDSLLLLMWKIVNNHDMNI